MPRSRRWLAGAAALLLQVGPAGLGRPEAATTSTPSSPPTTWEGDTSAVRLPAQFEGNNFFTVLGELARTQPAKGQRETPEQLQARLASSPLPQTWLAFRLGEHVSLEVASDSQLVSCRIDLKSAQTDDKGLVGAKVMTLHTEIQRGKSYSAQDERGFTLRINAGTREVQGLLLLTKEGEVAHAPSSFERTFALNRIQGARALAPLRTYAVCRVMALRTEHRALVDQESYTEPSAGLPVRLHNRLRYLCVHVASVWFVDSATGAIVHKEPFDPQD